MCLQVLRGRCSSRPCVTGRNRRVCLSSKRQTRKATSCLPTDPAGERRHSPVCAFACVATSAKELEREASPRLVNSTSTTLTSKLIFCTRGKDAHACRRRLPSPDRPAASEIRHFNLKYKYPTACRSVSETGQQEKQGHVTVVHVYAAAPLVAALIHIQQQS